jgi:hypothetical protein
MGKPFNRAQVQPRKQDHGHTESYSIAKGGCHMSNTILKNIDLSTPLDLARLVSYQEGQIVSRTLAQSNAVSLTLFAFAKSEEISSHASRGCHGAGARRNGAYHHW